VTVPSAVEAAIDIAALMARLKAAPFQNENKPEFFQQFPRIPKVLKLGRQARVRFPADYFYDHANQRVGRGVDRRNPPEMERERTDSIDKGKAQEGKRLNPRLPHAHNEEFWGRYKAVDYPGARNQETYASPNRNSAFHAVTPSACLG
jgi:hypothetical protein